MVYVIEKMGVKVDTMDARLTTERSKHGNAGLCQNPLPATIKYSRCVKVVGVNKKFIPLS